MKELSIEEKAKRYDEAIERAKAYHNDYTQDIMEDIFHELKESEESEGEKIREKLIDTFNFYDSAMNSPYLLGIHRNDIVAWLEKQGEQKPIDKVEPKFKVGDIIRFKGNETLKGEAETHKIVGYDNELYVFADGTTDLFCEQDLYELVEQKSTDKIEPKFKVGDKVYALRDRFECTIESIDELTYYGDTTNFDIKDQDNWKLVEQKPSDKVEPKFKVGDWVVDNKNGIVKQILSYKHGVYKHTYGYSGKIFENKWRMWTINDAKDGDVLCTYECDEPKIVFILKGTPKKHYALSYYCYYNIMYLHFGPDSEKGCLAPNDEDVKPATKEQRDILFQKMKEAGYEWDSEKKELRKIEQKSQRMISAEAKEAMYDKPAWSEEDERRYRGLHNLIYSTQYCDSRKELSYWLKSIKQRIGG